jgi:hypothetical protein
MASNPGHHRNIVDSADIFKVVLPIMSTNAVVNLLIRNVLHSKINKDERPYDK